MTVLEKIDYLEKALDLSEMKFAKKYKISFFLLKKWRNGQALPKKENLAYLCEQFGLSLGDFMDDNSSISYESKYADEHACIGKVNQNKPVSLIYEDYPREDNSRYEEVD